MPWWIFAIIGGFLTVWLGQDVFAGKYGLPQAADPADGAEVSYWMSLVASSPYFAPGAVVGGLFGLLFIRPINAVLGWLFRASIASSTR